MQEHNSHKWSEVIEAEQFSFKHGFRELWLFRDLFLMFIKRDFAAMYKQTALGPLWFFLQPLLTTIVYVVVFGKFGGFKTNGIPALPFYLSGVILWGFFSESFMKISTVFRDNANLFGKVYFPRILVPLSILTMSSIRFFIQLVLLFAVFIWYRLAHPELHLTTGWGLLLTPLILLILGGWAVALGMILSALTIKYRDLIFLLGFGVQLLMFATPVIYSIKTLPNQYAHWLQWNPLTVLFEVFRNTFFGVNEINGSALIVTSLMMLVTLLGSYYIFIRADRNFMDTV